MQIKVCGMREHDNVINVAQLGVDMIGFIFYSRSPRCVSTLAPATPPNIARVGVFVDEDVDKIEHIAQLNQLSHIQLHGKESVEVCQKLSQRWKVIKAISVSNVDDFATALLYEKSCDLLLFDTKCEQYGGSGQLFDWSLLESYQGVTPFILSGGISLQEIDEIKKISHSKLAGVDLNSRFECDVAIKDVKLLNKFITRIR